MIGRAEAIDFCVFRQPATKDASRANSRDAGRVESPELQVLVARAARGDSTAWAAVYDTLVDAVYRYVYTHTGQQAAAELLTLEAFLHAWRELQGGEWSSQPVLQWLYSQADIVRAERHEHQHLAGRPAEASRIDAVADQAAGHGGAPLSEAVARALRELSPEQQQVLLLRFGQRLDVAAIAELLGIDEATIQRVQLGGLKALQQVRAGPAPDG